MSHAPELHRCSVCFKCYKRREHLQRHSSTHSTERPHRCAFCNCAFQRADVQKRHSRTCDGKPNGLFGSTARRRACDRCVRQKRACNSCQPCQNCQRKAAPCHYSFVSNGGRPIDDAPLQTTQIDKESLVTDIAPVSSTVDTAMPFDLEDRHFENLAACALNDFSDSELFDYSSATWQDFLNLTSGNQTPRELSVSYLDGHRSFHFLDNFTRKTGLICSFDCGTPNQRQQVVSTFFQFEATYETVNHPVGSSVIPLLPGVLGEELVSTMERLDSASTLDSTSLTRHLSSYDPLTIKTHQIFILVKEVVTVKPRNSAVTLGWSPVLEQMCLRFFSPTNIRKFLELYWAVWHPNVNFVHRPTFNPVSSKSILLASMALIGACVSPDPVDNENAKTWFNCVEEMVFTDDDFSRDSPSTFDPPMFDPTTNRRKIQALQAAYMVCLYQNWEGTDASKRRIRRYRYSTVVSVARDISITTATHPNYDQQPKSEFDWNDFVAREELIRCFLWIVLLDTAFVIFNNLPPLMVIKEMKMHMACPEACFQAVTADECYGQIQNWMPDGSLFCKLTFRSAIESLCKESITQEMQQSLADLGPLNLFAITSALHSLIFQYQNSFSGEGQLVPIRNALTNWKGIWQLYSDDYSSTPPHAMIDSDDVAPEEMWKRIGFMRHAPEYWLLASAIMDRISALDARQQQNSTRAAQNGSEPVDNEPVDPILNKYDQTSMRQVNDLIADFQKVQIQ